jgi:quercetin dioxygenase-like cupin family protein
MQIIVHRMQENPLVQRIELNRAGPEAAPWGRIGENWSARPHSYPKGCVHRGHAHVVEHVTYLEKGRISIKRDDRALPVEYAAPMWIEMPARVWHEITALEDSFWYCIFFDARPAGELAPFDAERA